MESVSRREFAQRLSAFGLAAPALAGSTQGFTAPASAGSLTDVAGIRVGHYTDTRRPTGCTAILFDEAATAGVDYDGTAPGEMLGVMLQPVSPIDRIHGLLLTGGGPMGLAAVAGATRWLEAKGRGFDWGVPNVRIPLVVGAVIDDLSVGDGRIRPDADMAERACAAATTSAVAEGCVGAGAGATVGKMFRGHGLPGMKGGIGTASIRHGDLVVAALAVVNAAGDILDWRTGRIIAGALTADGTRLADSRAQVAAAFDAASRSAAVTIDDAAFHSTTLGVVATNIAVDKTRLTKLAMMANTGASRAIAPYHTEGDGDQLYAFSTNRVQRDVPLTVLGSLAADVLGTAIGRGVQMATGVPGWKAVRDLEGIK
jgi:L-aminopeptidase/D-esterase-like protein